MIREEKMMKDQMMMKDHMHQMDCPCPGDMKKEMPKECCDKDMECHDGMEHK